MKFRSNAFPISTPGRNVDQLMKRIYNSLDFRIFLMSCESKSFCSFMIKGGQISLFISFDLLIADSLFKVWGGDTKAKLVLIIKLK